MDDTSPLGLWLIIALWKSNKHKKVRWGDPALLIPEVGEQWLKDWDTMMIARKNEGYGGIRYI